jgi:AhpD family alkylhydroperoxidase
MKRTMAMTEALYPKVTRDLARMRRELAPDASRAFHDFSNAVFADGALSTKTKHIIAVAVAHVTQCPYCIKGHTRAALNEGASAEELMEAIWVAAEMRSGAAFAHSVIALAEIQSDNNAKANGHAANGLASVALHPA